MSNTQNPKKEYIVKSFKEKFEDNLFAIISAGSMTTSHYLETWSDIDLLVVLEHLSFADKLLMADLKLLLENKYHQRFGINVITKQEALTPSMPEITLDGKTLQCLLEVSIYPQRLMYCKGGKESFFVPDRKTVRAYSLSNIAMFLLRNRKTLTARYLNDIELKTAAEKEIRASFIMTKLAVQYENGYMCESYEDIIQRSKEVFSSFDFKTLSVNRELIQHWKSIMKRDELIDILDKTDKYIELFADFILKKAED